MVPSVPDQRHGAQVADQPVLGDRQVARVIPGDPLIAASWGSPYAGSAAGVTKTAFVREAHHSCARMLDYARKLAISCKSNQSDREVRHDSCRGRADQPARVLAPGGGGGRGPVAARAAGGRESGSRSSAAARRGSWRRRTPRCARRRPRRDRRVRRLGVPGRAAATTGSSRSPAPAPRPRCSTCSAGCAAQAPTDRDHRRPRHPGRRLRRRRRRARLRRRAVGRADPVRHHRARAAPRPPRRHTDAVVADAGDRARRAAARTASSSADAVHLPRPRLDRRARQRGRAEDARGVARPGPRRTRRWSTATARSASPRRARAIWMLGEAPAGLAEQVRAHRRPLSSARDLDPLAELVRVQRLAGRGRRGRAASTRTGPAT